MAASGTQPDIYKYNIDYVCTMCHKVTSIYMCSNLILPTGCYAVDHFQDI